MHKLLDMQAKLYNFAFMLTSNRDDANDLLQDTTLKAMVYNDIFRGNSVEDARAVKGRASRGGRGACRGLFGLFA